MSDTAAAKRAESAADRADPMTQAVQEDPSTLFAGRGSLAARVERGKAARSKAPRAKLAECKIADRDPIALLDASNVGRVPELIPIRYGRMVANPFSFYRGAAPLMAHDLSKLPHSNMIVQLGTFLSVHRMLRAEL